MSAGSCCQHKLEHFARDGEEEEDDHHFQCPSLAGGECLCDEDEPQRSRREARAYAGLPAPWSIREVVSVAREVLCGMMLAMWGVGSVLHNPRLVRDYGRFARSMGLVLVGLYSAAVVVLFVALPIVAFVPGIALQLLALLPGWALSLTRSRAPQATPILFLDELKEVNPGLRDELRYMMAKQKGRTWVGGMKDDAHRSWHFTRYSLLLLAFSIIPVVGPVVAFFGQIALVANRLGWTLMSVYTQDCRKMNYRQQKAWMRAHRWVIFGFALPFSLVTSIPFVGPLLMGLAEGASVHLVGHLTESDPGHQAWRERIQREKQAEEKEEVHLTPASSDNPLRSRTSQAHL